MGPGQQRKRLVKLARRYSDEQLRAMVQPGPDAHPVYFVLQSHGMELIGMWSRTQGLLDVTIEDDVREFAICHHLIGRGLVFDCASAALEYGKTHGLMEPTLIERPA